MRRYQIKAFLEHSTYSFRLLCEREKKEAASSGGGKKDGVMRVRKYRVVKSFYCVLVCRHCHRRGENDIAFTTRAVRSRD